MKSVRILVTLLTLSLGALSLSAQTATAAKPAGKVIPNARVAWINSAQFTDEASGIKQLVRILKELELEFSGQQGELSLLSEKLRTIVGELNKLQAAATPDTAAIQQKQTDGLKLQQEMQGKQQQFQAAVQAAQQAKQGPVVAELTKALAAYTKDHDLSLVFDVAKLGDAVVSASPTLDITEDFIASFNASHP